MKKPYLLLLAIVPIFGSCNKNGSFPNPFPKDEYTKIGFKVDENTEKITRPLTNAETNIVVDTITAKEENDAKIFSMTGSRQTRDYTRAFAGEFKQGYNVSNVMKSETYTVTRQDEASTPSPTVMTDRARTRIHNESSTVSQYSYGEIQENVKQDDYYYFAKHTESAEKTDWEEASKKSESNSFNIRTQKIENEKYTSYFDSLIYKKEDYQEAELKKYQHLHQSDYIFTPDAKCGANSKGEIILFSATQTQHKDTPTSESGIFHLKDGRKYQAIDNSLKITKLTIQDDKKWCLATYVRIYTETVITSEVIQPNVSVTKLKNPITISYSEEINHYSVTPSPIDGKLPGDKTT